MASSIPWRALAAAHAHMSAHDIPLTNQEAVSGIFGSISLVSWFFVFIPQMIENYGCGSADAVSILFLFVWFAGDVLNLIGALWAGLVPTVIATAAYFCFSDISLCSQCVYYNIKNARKARTLSTVSEHREATEDEPLLSRRDSNQSIGLPGSHRRRRSSVASRRTANGDEAGPTHGNVLTKIAEEDSLNNERSTKMQWVMNIASILLICLIGGVIWVLCWKLGVWKPSPVPGQESSGGKHNNKEAEKSVPVGAEILGYLSAVLYLGARIPQIIKNWREQSCEGLSLLFFLLSLLGNLTYGASILTHSLDKEYLLINLPWLIGSLGTMAEDVTIFIQFRLYGDRQITKQTPSSSEAIE